MSFRAYKDGITADVNCRAAPIKRTAVERQVNIHIIFLFFLLMALSLGSTIGSSIRTVRIFVVLKLLLSFDFRCSGSSLVNNGIFPKQTLLLEEVRFIKTHSDW